MNVDKGYVEGFINPAADLLEDINVYKKLNNAVVMSHFYQSRVIQDAADYIGDSLALAQMAAKTDADVIVVCGVHFMGETAKILNPDKKVIVPDLNAGCSLADSCPADEFEQFIAAHPGHTVITYVNTSAAVKAMSDIVVTSSNALKIINSLPRDEKIIFGPDRNLGNYISSLTGRDMVIWNGACHVHEQFSVESLIKLKEMYPEAKVLVHPECPEPIRLLADKIGSTQALLDFTIASPAQEFIVATESGILTEMRRRNRDNNKRFYPVPPEGGLILTPERRRYLCGGLDECGYCNECRYMRLITLDKLYLSMVHLLPTIEVDPDIARRALVPIKRMLELS